MVSVSPIEVPITITVTTDRQCAESGCSCWTTLDCHATASRLRALQALCAIYPTWYERAAGWVMVRCWRINETSGPVNWVGDLLDDLRVVSWRRRARRRLALDRRAEG